MEVVPIWGACTATWTSGDIRSGLMLRTISGFTVLPQLRFVLVSRGPGSGLQPVNLLVSKGYSAARAWSSWEAHTITWAHGAIKVRAAAESRVCVNSFAAPRVWTDVYGFWLMVMLTTGLWAGNSGHVGVCGSHYYRDHAESGSLRPWWHLNLSCVLRLCLGL